jgi:PAS domain S-box-containing protein
VLQVERESTTLIRTQHISEGVVLVVVLSVLGSGALLIIRPITQRAIQAYASLAHAEAALRVSEQRYRTLVTSLHEGVVLQHHDGSIQACNPSAEQMLGLTSDQLVGRTSIDPRWRAVREDGSDFPGDEHPAMVALRTGKPSRGEIMGVHKSDDTVTWLTVNAQPLFQPEAQTPYAVVTSFFDITEQRRIEQEVRYQKTLLECLCEASLDGILVVSPDRRWLYLNQRFASMWNFSDEVVAAASSAIGLPAMLEQVVDSARARARIEAIYANIHPSGQEELHLHDGRIFERYSAPVLHGDGTFYGRVWYYRDVTEREAVARAKRAFVSAVSHELRTPLTAIHFAIGMINSGKAGDVSEQMRPIIAIVYNNSERLIRLINDILDSEKFEISAVSFVLAPVALVPLVQQALDANRHYAASFDVSLVLEPVAAEIWVNVDSDRLMQVLTNLLSNAAKFSPFGGVVTTAISTYDNTVRIAVTDQGPGIPPEFQPRIFEKFAQADDPTSWRKGGTGLGLNIARSIIERLGGTIGFTTSTNGTTFFVELPIWREPMPTRYLAEHKACIA